MRCKILYEDAYLLVVHKPAGLATQTSKVGEADVVSELKNALSRKAASLGEKKSPPYLGVIHRLDQPVEGLLVFAKDPKTAAGLTKQLSEGTLNKQYYAVVCGKPAAPEGKLVDYLWKDASGKARVAEKESADSPGVEVSQAKEAVLSYRLVREISPKEGLYLMDIHIETGRFHQIRAQMSHAGLPLLGDKKYGTEASIALSVAKKMRNVALYAYRIEFVHPATGQKCCYDISEELKLY